MAAFAEAEEVPKTREARTNCKNATTAATTPATVPITTRAKFHPASGPTPYMCRRARVLLKAFAPPL